MCTRLACEGHRPCPRRESVGNPHPLRPGERRTTPLPCSLERTQHTPRPVVSEGCDRGTVASPRPARRWELTAAPDAHTASGRRGGRHPQRLELAGAGRRAPMDQSRSTTFLLLRAHPPRPFWLSSLELFICLPGGAVGFAVRLRILPPSSAHREGAGALILVSRERRQERSRVVDLFS